MQKKLLAICVVIVASIIGFALFMGKNEIKTIPDKENIAYDFSKDIDRHGFEWDFSNRVEKQAKDITDLQEKFDAKDENTIAMNEALEAANTQNQELTRRLDVLEEKLYASSAKQYRGLATPSSTEHGLKNGNSQYQDSPEEQIYSDESSNSMHFEDDNKITVHKFALEPLKDNKFRNISNTIPSNSLLEHVLQMAWMFQLASQASRIQNRCF